MTHIDQRSAGRRGALLRRGLLAAGALTISQGPLAAQDPLPSWHDGATRQSIVRFVQEATTPGGPNFVPPELRIAVFDNDGTLWTEQPMYVQAVFAVDRLRARAREDPGLLRNPAIKNLLDSGTVRDAPSEPPADLARLVAAMHAGWTIEQYEQAVLEWLAAARHPRFQRRYTELVYQPMLELIAYLRSNGFKTYIVSGGSQDFMRPWVEEVYGIPREWVVGSTMGLKYQLLRDTLPSLIRQPDVDFIDDGPGKPVGIARHIGRRPVAAAGNSDGDRQMLEYTAGGRMATLMLLVHHDDCEREYCYSPGPVAAGDTSCGPSPCSADVGRLDSALTQARRSGWTVISMKNDWRYIYPFQVPGTSVAPATQ